MSKITLFVVLAQLMVLPASAFGGSDEIAYERIKEARRLCYLLVNAHAFVGEEEFISEEDVAKVLADFRAFLA